MLVAIAASVVLGPRVFTSDGGPEPPAEVVVAAVGQGSEGVALLEPRRDQAPTSTVVLTPALSVPEPSVPEPAPSESDVPAAAPPTTETIEAAEAPPAPTTTEAPTTTTAPPPPPEEPPAPAPTPAALSVEHADGTQEGDVSWYDLPGSRSGVCAHRIIEKGTVVTVTNLDTGESTTCTVDDRGPYSGDDKVLDLHRDEFSRLAPLEQGVFPARLDW